MKKQFKQIALKHITLIVLMCFGATAAMAQISSVALTEKPVDWQLYPIKPYQSLITNVRFAGKLTNSGYKQLRFISTQNGQNDKMISINVTSPNMVFSQDIPLAQAHTMSKDSGQ